MFYNVEDLAIQVVMELYKCLAILVLKQIRFLVLLGILARAGRWLLILRHGLDQVFDLLVRFLDPLSLQTQLV